MSRIVKVPELVGAVITEALDYPLTHVIRFTLKDGRKFDMTGYWHDLSDSPLSENAPKNGEQ